MGLTPATNRQVPDHAILDFYNKQTYLGNGFIAEAAASLTDASEVPLIYIANPVVTSSAFPSSFLSIFNNMLNLSCHDVAGLTDIVYKIYIGASGVSSGSVINPINLRLASATTSIATVLKSPTVVTKGTLVQTIVVGSDKQIKSDTMFVLDPGKNMLITAQGSAATGSIADLIWFEL